MQSTFGEYEWNNIKIDLKVRYPMLTDADLLWRDGNTKADLVKEIAVRVGISWNELDDIINNF